MPMLLQSGLPGVRVGQQSVHSRYLFGKSFSQFSPPLFKSPNLQFVKSCNNLVVSPFAAELLLGFASTGARNKTSQEIAIALHSPYNSRDAEAACKTILPHLTKNENCKLNLGTKIYVNKSLSIKKDFRNGGKKFLAEIENINFVNPGDVVKIINDWIRKITNDKIQDLIELTVLSPDIKMVLISGAFFQGKWLQPFHYTECQNFFKSKNEVVKVEMMENTGSYNYYESQTIGAKFLELRFIDESIAMVIVLPNDREGLDEIENHSHEIFLHNNSFTLEQIKISLPKFKIESLIDFKPILQYVSFLTSKIIFLV